MSQYATSLEISNFAGINQSGDGYNMSMRYAREMENVNVDGGGFRPMRDGIRLEQTLRAPIGTLAYLNRRFGNETGTLLVAISDGRVYTKLLDGDDDWEQRYPAYTETVTDGETVRAETGAPLEVSDCDWVTYEVNIRDGQPLTDPVDILLFTNATDGMFCLYGDTKEVVRVVVAPNPEDDIRFGVLARYNERIWGSGIAGDPDKLMYSVPYDPFDWSANTEIPEDGAGDILQPTWDGDSFVALRQIGSDLLAVKRNSIWRIYGTNPGEFSMQRQYGGGALVENTLAIQDGYAYMLGQYGLLRYDGSGAYAFQQDAIQGIMHDRVKHEITALLEYSETRVYMLGDICSHEGAVYRCVVPINHAEEWTAAHWEEISGDPVSRACAGMWNGVYCLALPFYGSANNNAILQYDTRSGAFSLRTDVSVDSFLQINERLFYTSADYPGAVYELDDRKGRVKHLKWVSGYQDLGVKSSIKSAFTVYFYAETEVPVTLRLGLRTEKKLKQKIVTAKPGKMTRTHLNTQGRIFRLEIESITAVPYAIAGGIKIDLELDPD